ncbi:hypothetical protein RCL1_000688 [Eukaryota sp. TZLM3-RCL]
MSLKLSRILLHHGLHRLLRSYSSSEPKLQLIFRFLSSFGNVSIYFRSVLSEVISYFLTSVNPSFHIPFHQTHLQLLSQLCPLSHSFCLKTTLLSREGEGDNFSDFSAFKFHQLTIDQRQLISEQRLFSLFEANSFSHLEELIVHTACNESICLLISLKLPNLKSVSFLDSLLDSSFTIPSSLSSLFSFSYSSVMEHSELTLDLSNLTKLHKVSIDCLKGISLSGLSELDQLKDVHFDGVIQCDLLHPKAYLCSVDISRPSTEFMELFFANKRNFRFASIDLMFGVVPPSCNWLFSCNLRSLTIGSGKNTDEDDSFETSRVPFVRKLMAAFGEGFPLTFDSCARLESLFLFAAFYDYHPNYSFTDVLPITFLSLDTFDLPSLFFFLSQCPYLKTLDLKRQVPYSGNADGTFTISLNRLESLQLTAVRSFLDLLPRLLRLKRLALHHVKELDLNFINSSCPNLSCLILQNCTISKSFSTPNNSITKLKYTSHTPDALLPCTDFFINFAGVLYFSLSVSSDQNVESLLFPPSVTAVYCSAPLKLVSSSLSTAPFLTTLSLNIRVVFDDPTALDETRNWISGFDKFLPPNVHHISVSFNIVSGPPIQQQVNDNNGNAVEENDDE